jgi:3-ketosteroid 9alpha-monooxygenase subunit B
MAEDPRHQYYELTVAEVISETADAASFVFAIPDELRSLFSYCAGQFLTFRVPWQGMELQRCYSLASSPERGEGHKVTVKRIDDGRISNWFNDELRAGSRIRVLPPEGRFVLRASDRKILLFSGGSGITPVISLIKTALVSSERPLKLVYANRDRDAIIFREELERLVAAHPTRLEVVHHLDMDRGFLDVGGAKAHLAGWEDADVYLCGPAEFMDVVEDALEAVGVERAHIHVERFVSPTDPDRAADAAAPVPSGDAFPAEIVLKLDGATHRLPYTPGKTLLETAKEADLTPPFACEEGYCSTCMAKLVRGQVSMRTNDALTARDLEDGWILTCQGVPQSDECEIDWDAA